MSTSLPLVVVSVTEQIVKDRLLQVACPVPSTAAVVVDDPVVNDTVDEVVVVNVVDEAVVDGGVEDVVVVDIEVGVDDIDAVDEVVVVVVPPGACIIASPLTSNDCIEPALFIQEMG
jgi:hypothetical protein